MRAICFILNLCVVITTVVAIRIKVDATCHPQCKWLCDDPVCPAKCHPVCAHPKCQMNCEPTGCASCEVRCEEPVCNVRCPKEMCESKNCPSCETVCRPAVCRTTCTAPEPKCTPLCEATKCAWKCQTPTQCPRPKCQLACEKPKCGTENHFPGTATSALEINSQKCCPCQNKESASLAIRSADLHSQEHGVAPDSPRMSLLEVMHTSAFNEQAGTMNENRSCCPCR